jgi:hypothetical protein
MLGTVAHRRNAVVERSKTITQDGFMTPSQLICVTIRK